MTTSGAIRFAVFTEMNFGKRVYQGHCLCDNETGWLPVEQPRSRFSDAYNDLVVAFLDMQDHGKLPPNLKFSDVSTNKVQEHSWLVRRPL